MTDSINPLELLAALGITDAEQVTPVMGGAASAIWRVNWRGRQYGMRLLPPGDSTRELAAMETARAGGIPVPVVYQTTIWQGRPLMFMDWISGEPLVNALFQQSEHVAVWSRDFGRMQAAVHRLNAPPDFDPDAWIRWAGDPELEPYLRRLPVGRLVLLHLDFHPNNILFDADGLSGVLDWTNARAGDPRADVARTYTILRLDPVMPDPPPELPQLRRQFARQWLQGYRAAGGIVEGMTPFFAWAGALMLRDLAPRIGTTWMQDFHLEPIRRWTAYWKRKLRRTG